MVVEAPLIVDDDKGGQNESLVLKRLVVLLLEKTQNLEQIQGTYERDLDTLRQRLNDQESTIQLLSEDVGNLSARVTTPIKSGPSSLKTSVPHSARAGSQTSEDPVSPGLSSSLQDVFNQLEFLNDKSIKLESISSLSDGKHSPSLQLNEEHLGREEEETLRKPTPIFVTTLSYDTSTYNDSMNTSDSGGEEIEEVCADENNGRILQCSAPDPVIVEKKAPTTMKSMKKKTVVSQTMVTKIPIVLQDASCDEDETHDFENIKREEEDTFDETSLQSSQQSSTNLPAEDSKPKVDDFKLQFPWTRSDTFDVIPVSQTSVIAVPVKPKRGIVSPLQTQRYPTERSDTLGDISYSEKAPLQALPNESTEPSDHSTFSQVSSNRSSSFDYEVQYIMPQLSEDDSHRSAENENKSGAVPMNFNFDATVTNASSSDFEDDVITPQ